MEPNNEKTNLLTSAEAGKEEEKKSCAFDVWPWLIGMRCVVQCMCSPAYHRVRIFLPRLPREGRRQVLSEFRFYFTPSDFEHLPIHDWKA